MAWPDKKIYGNKEAYLVKAHPKHGLWLYAANGDCVGTCDQIKLVDKVEETFWIAEVRLLVNVQFLKEEDTL